MSRINWNDDEDTGDELNSLEDQSDRSRTASFSSGFEITPCDTPPRERPSPRMPRRSLQLSDDATTWKVVTKKKKKSRKFKVNWKSSATKIQSTILRAAATEFRFKIAVCLLFITIVLLVIFTNYFYKRERSSKAIRDQFLFIQSQRKFHVMNSKGHDLLKASLAINIPNDIPAISCDNNNTEVCLDWKYRAKLTINYEHQYDGVNCYTVKWKSYEKNSKLKDCFDLSDSLWYGMGEVFNISWPLNRQLMNLSPFVTNHKINSKTQFGSLINRYWISSMGVAIYVPIDVPLFISINENHDNRLCFESRTNQYPYYSRDTIPFMEYKICSSSDIIKLHMTMVKNNFKLGYQNDTNLDQLFEHHFWAIDHLVLTNFTQQSLQSYADRITNYGFEPGFIILDSRWENHIGDLTMNQISFPSASTLFNILHNRGFKVLVKITPNIEINAEIFEKAVSDGILLTNQDLDVPLLTRCGEELENICGIIDFKISKNIKWFKKYLNSKVKKNLGIDGYVFVNGQSSLLPNHYSKRFLNPDNYLLYYKEVSHQSGFTNGISSAIGFGRYNAFVNMMQRNSSWEMLRTIIPTVLTLGLIGFPIVNPGTVGGCGGYNNESDYDKELYLRWFQLSSFLPIMQFTEPSIGDDQITKVTKHYLKIRETTIVSALKKALSEYQQNGVPIIRPLWWLQPDAMDAYSISDQFAIGNDIVVAPIVEKNKVERDIYLPFGWWRDHIQEQVIRGGKWMRKYDISMDKIAYFIRTDQSYT